MQNKIIKYIFVCTSIFLSFSGYVSAFVFHKKPFLSLPFSSKYQTGFLVTEGRWYSGSLGHLATMGTGEYFVHGIKKHSSIDYALPYGTPVLAPIDGYLIASYQDSFLFRQGVQVLYQNKAVHYGRGWFVQIWNPTHDVFVLLGHLASLDEQIPVSPPYPVLNKTGDIIKRSPTGITYNTGSIYKMSQNPTKYPGVVYVKKGQRIGTVGISGIDWGNTMRSALAVPRHPGKYDESLTRDEPHIHMEVFAMSGTQKVHIDPYNIYHDYRGYPDSNTKKYYTPASFFLQDSKGRILFADE